MMRAAFRFIFPTREILTSHRGEADDWQFSVAHNGWFAKYRDVEIYRLGLNTLMHLGPDGWAAVDDDELVIYFREHIAGKQRAFEQMVADCTE